MKVAVRRPSGRQEYPLAGVPPCARCWRWKSVLCIACSARRFARICGTTLQYKSIMRLLLAPSALPLIAFIAAWASGETTCLPLLCFWHLSFAFSAFSAAMQCWRGLAAPCAERRHRSLLPGCMRALPELPASLPAAPALLPTRLLDGGAHALLRKTLTFSCNSTLYILGILLSRHDAENTCQRAPLCHGSYGGAGGKQVGRSCLWRLYRAFFCGLSANDYHIPSHSSSSSLLRLYASRTAAICVCAGSVRTCSTVPSGHACVREQRSTCSRMTKSGTAARGLLPDILWNSVPRRTSRWISAQHTACAAYPLRVPAAAAWLRTTAGSACLCSAACRRRDAAAMTGGFSMRALLRARQTPGAGAAGRRSYIPT